MYFGSDMNFKKAFQGIRREKKNSHKLFSPNRIKSNNLSGKILLHLQDLVLTFFLWKALLNSMQRLHAHSTHHSILWLCVCVCIYIYFFAISKTLRTKTISRVSSSNMTSKSECQDFSKQLRNECKKASICNIFILIEAKIACE